MSTYTPEWFARRGIQLTPTGELAVIVGAAVIAVAWIAALIITAAVVTDALGGGGGL